MAEKTGWSEDFILWELPLRRLYQYYHVALRSADLWTVIPMPSANSMAQLALMAAQELSEADKEDIGDDAED